MPKIFLYGPDTQLSKLSDRVGPVEIDGGAVLRRHSLVFDKPNLKRRGEGLPNLAPADDSLTFGLLCELTPSQIETLDGYYGGYERRAVSVVIQPKDMHGTVSMKATPAEAYFARRVAKNLLPTKAVLDATIKGAEDHRAPGTFLEVLHTQKVIDG